MPNLAEIIALVPAIMLALTVHEYAHGFVADRLGDHTARYAGRLTLNPVAHVDWLGLLLLFVAGFGWAKPVPVNPYNLRGNVKQGLLLVSLAGPAANLVLALAASVLLGLIDYMQSGFGLLLLYQLIYINVVLAVFNLIPVPPLDGSKILAGLLPGRQEWLVALEQYGVLVLLVLMVTGLIGKFLTFFVVPLAEMFFNLARGLAA
ncbi:MAG: site-2 protease family protein [Thermoanaerobacterales bacterium]|nr:site-2 protease family protein [Thermoanaerobacterales bacterium]